MKNYIYLFSLLICSITLPTQAFCNCQENAGYAYAFQPTLLDHKDHYELRICAPGFAKGDIKVSVESDLLIVKGKQSLSVGKDTKVYGPSKKTFAYCLPLGSDVLQNTVKATVKEGLLVITAQKDPKKQAKTITIE